MKLFSGTFLKPSESVMVSMATAAVVYGIYQGALPTIAEAHATDPYNINLDAARKKAMWESAAVVGGMFLLTHDPNVFIVGGAAFLVLEWAHRHANSTHPNTGKMAPYSKATALGSYTEDAAPVYEGYADNPGY